MRRIMRRLFVKAVARQCGNVACDSHGSDVPPEAEGCERCSQPPKLVVHLDWRALSMSAAAVAVLLLGCCFGAERVLAHRAAQRRALELTQTRALLDARSHAEAQSAKDAAERRLAAVNRSLARGQALIGQHQYQEARQELALATHGDPGNAMAWASLGAANMLLGQSGEALDCYDKALALEPKNWLAHYNLGLFSERRGDREAALGHLRVALGALPAASRVRREVIRDLLAEPGLEGVRHDPRFAGVLGGEPAEAAGSLR